LLADFEISGVEYSFDDAVWEEAVRLAEAEVAKANERVAARCLKLGIPKDFAPKLNCYWGSRGENAAKERRDELRKLAITRIDAMEKAAIVRIELESLNGQTEIATHGITSVPVPSIESLMPSLSYEEVAGNSKPPIVEQLVSPGALRQRRFRERHRNAQVTSRNSDGKTPAIEEGQGRGLSR
jgi:hypothetical protein